MSYPDSEKQIEQWKKDREEEFKKLQTKGSALAKEKK